MIDGSPSVFDQLLPERRSTGVDAFVAKYVDDYWFYGSGKVALRDGLATVADEGGNVLVPSYLPDAVVEPIRELGLEPRYYAITDDLSPNLTDLESRIDDETVALVSVDYFGFPQPNFDELSALARAYDCYHVDDNAHAPFSVHEGRLLGTVGDLGVTSLRKLLPIPNGALLYVTDDALGNRFEPSALGGVNDRFDRRDVRFLLSSFAKGLLERNDAVRRSIDGFVASFSRDPSTVDPADRYEAAKGRMSALSARALRDVDPGAIRARRRDNYRTWLDALARRTGVAPLFRTLPAGLCPQAVPVYARRPQRFLTDLSAAGVNGAYTWPRLSPSVVENPTYETATHLSRHVVALPVHHRLDPETIETAGRSLAA